MRIGFGDWTYEWIDHWATLPDNPSSKDNGRTHGVAVTKSGNVIVFCQANPAVLTFDPNGKMIDAWGDRFGGAHGLTLVTEGDEEFLWLVDQDSGEVVKTTLDGKTVQSIAPADHPVYSGEKAAKYVPTWAAVNPSNGEVWVTDGYGSSHIHRYNKDGEYLATINGSEGEAGEFRCPHGIAFDPRPRADKAGEELYIADRSNKQVQVYDGEGKYLRVIGTKTLHTPCMFSFCGEYVVIPQLHARVDVLDGADRVVAMLGDNGHTCDIKGWPNHNVAGNRHLLEPGKFNSPHGACMAPNGDIFVVEWIVGGRITKLVKSS